MQQVGHAHRLSLYLSLPCLKNFIAHLHDVLENSSRNADGHIMLIACTRIQMLCLAIPQPAHTPTPPPLAPMSTPAASPRDNNLMFDEPEDGSPSSPPGPTPSLPPPVAPTTRTYHPYLTGNSSYRCKTKSCSYYLCSNRYTLYSGWSSTASWSTTTSSPRSSRQLGPI